ncbi:MAG: ergothioneine biosynthesis protein EgtB [bacterium]|nr:ergothioneine biosynthesis protein EgtB [bacterium]
MHSSTTKSQSAPASLRRRFLKARSATEHLVRPLAEEDFVVQSMPDVSPTKWHMAHVTWFFETFVLRPHLDEYQVKHPKYEFLFNSYYNAVGPQFSRPRRGLLTRPTVSDVREYRRYVDDAVERFLVDRGEEIAPELTQLIELGIQHEQQHQELILMDIKHVLSCNPLYPHYHESGPIPDSGSPGESVWTKFPEGLEMLGYSGDGFAYDNEMPEHRIFLEGFQVASRPVTNAEFLEFIEDGGYRDPAPWLADGWAVAREQRWEAPLYWTRQQSGWHEFTLGGLKRLNPHAPVCHVSYYEADAFASWAGARLPTEGEWERVVRDRPVEGNFVEGGWLHPEPGPAAGDGPHQLYGDVWEWTCSPYVPYPGFKAPEGAVGEYNGKFMCNQQVLRGGSCVTPLSHIRPTYRNFFYPHCRWQFAGIRLAANI